MEVFDLRPGTHEDGPTPLAELNSKAYFRLGAPGGWVYETDGTAAGTKRFCNRDPYTSADYVAASNNRLFFQGERLSEPRTGAPLWTSDGSCDGTKLLATFDDDIDDFTSAGRRMFFTANDGGMHQLWISDGTRRGTESLLTQSEFIEGEGDIGILGVAGAYAYFAVDVERDGSVRSDLWRSDGTRQGTRRLVRDDDDSFFHRIGFNGRYAWFIQGGYLWRTAGTRAETLKLRLPEPLSANRLVPFSDGIAFSELSETSAVWTVTKSNSGWQFRKLWRDETGELVTGLTSVKDRLFFSGVTTDEGREPYVSDGTRAGTRLIADLAPGPADSLSSPSRDLRDWPLVAAFGGDRVLFQARDPNDPDRAPLWVSDGTRAHTRMIEGSPDLAVYVTEALGQFFLHGWSSEIGEELWKIEQH